MKEKQDIIIIGAGIMGLFTAYYLSLCNKKVTIIDKSYIGNPKTASYGITRSLRSDYLDATYALLAQEAIALWKELEQKTKKQFIVNAGCLNLATKAITPDVKNTYAEIAYQNLLNLGIDTQAFSKTTLKKRFPQFRADIGRLDTNGGFLYLPRITKTLVPLLKKGNVTIKENTTISRITETATGVSVYTQDELIRASRLVIVAGLGTNPLIKKITACRVQFPLIPDKPQERKYYIPPKNKRYLFYPKNFPVFAYLDIGFYGHPIYDAKTKGVKISYYNPQDIKKVTGKISTIKDFVTACIPALNDAKVIDNTDSDSCYYDMVKDDEFILGKLPGYKNIYVGVGWRGTGYKFAPLIGKILSQLAISSQTIYDIKRFSPERFV